MNFKRQAGFFTLIMLLTLLGGQTHLIAQESSHEELANSFFFQRDYTNAAKEYFLALNNDPDNVTLRYNLAYCYEKTSNYTDALTEYRETLRLDPNHKQANEAIDRLTKYAQNPAFDEANVAFFEKNYDDAIKVYKTIIEFDTENYKAFYNLGFCYEQKREYVEALNSYRAANNINNTEESQKAVDRLNARVTGDRVNALKEQIEGDILANRIVDARRKIDDLLALDSQNDWARERRTTLDRRIQQDRQLTQQRQDDQKKSNEQIQKLDQRIAELEKTPKESDPVEKTDDNSGDNSGNNNSIPQNNPNSTPLILYIGIGTVVLLVGGGLMVAVSRRGKKETISDELAQKGVYGALQEFYNVKKTGILSAGGLTKDGLNVVGEVRMLNGNIVDAHTEDREGVPALHQLMDIVRPKKLEFQAVNVSSSGNIKQATLPLLMQWTLGQKKEE